MSKNLKVGDRVKVYGFGCSIQQTLFFDGVKGTINSELKNNDMTVFVALDTPINSVHVIKVHENQCRRLKPKNPRRRIWIHKDKVPNHIYNPNVTVFANKHEALDEEKLVEFVEVRRKREKK